MADTFYRWTGRLSSEWTDDNGTLTNWTNIFVPTAPPAFPSGEGDKAFIDSGGDVTVSADNGPGNAENLQILSSTTVTFTSGNFGFGAHQELGGLVVDSDGTLVVASGVAVANTGGEDFIGLAGSGTLEIQSGAGFDDFRMRIGAWAGSDGEVTVDGAFFGVVQSSPGSDDGQLTVGDQGDGSLSLTDNALFFAASTVVGNQAGSNGDVTLDDSTWSGSSLLIGPAGNGSVLIDNGATAAIGNVTIGPNGELDVTGIAGKISSLTAVSLTLVFGTLTIDSGGEVSVGGNATQGALDIAIDVAGLGTINGNVVVEQGAALEAIQPLAGTLTINGNVTGAGEIDPLQTLEVNGGIGAGIDIAFDKTTGAQGELVLDVPRGDLGTITGFDVGHSIDVMGLVFSNAVFTPGTGGNPGTLTLSGGSDAPLELKVDGDYAPDAFLATPGTDDTLITLVPCYCPGTLIRTPHGETPVEELRIGDAVMTAKGVARPVKWIGRRSYDGRFVGGNKDVLPVCIKAGALAYGVPRRDLWISPHHAMYFEDGGGVLVEAKDLVNGVSIVQAEAADKVEYVHVELKTHDVIIAEGAPSETFVDDGSRGVFHNAGEYALLYPDAVVGPLCFCAPRLDWGHEVEAVRRRIAKRRGLRRTDAEPRIGALRGFVDVIGPDCIAGWVQNEDYPEAPVSLDITAAGIWLGQVLANQYRADLEQAGLGSGRHGFVYRPARPLQVDLRDVEVRRSLDQARLPLTDECDIRIRSAA